jgi:hypothetical protein
VAKISDFGLARDVQKNQQYLRTSTVSMQPSIFAYFGLFSNIQFLIFFVCVVMLCTQVNMMFLMLL